MDSEMNHYFYLKQKVEDNRLVIDAVEAMLKNLQREIEEYMNDFLPKDYSVPSASDKYMKFEQGENRFRILSEKAIVGWEWWIDTADKKRAPQRIPMSQTIPVDAVDDPSEIKHFWAMVVWNYKTEKIQVLEITQKGIQRTLTSLLKDADWGSPRGYDIVVTKTGEKMETKYDVMPKPAKKMEGGIERMYKDMHVNLEALYKGEDPFAEVDGEEIAEEADNALA